jgi:hypothetical protein
MAEAKRVVLEIPPGKAETGPWNLYSTKSFAQQVVQMEGIARVRGAIADPEAWRVFPKTKTCDVNEILNELVLLCDEESLSLEKGRLIH